MSDSSLGRSSPLVPPLYQSSVYILPDLDVLDRIMTGEAAGYIYARDGHPNAQFLADQLADIERAKWQGDVDNVSFRPGYIGVDSTASAVIVRRDVRGL